MSTIDKEIYAKFPAIIQKQLDLDPNFFPEGVKFSYENIIAYRCIKRPYDEHPINRDDFRSYAEEGKRPHRAQKKASVVNLHSVSFFTKKEKLENVMNLPHPKKKIICGKIHEQGGPQETDLSSSHVHWWLYENADISEFKIESSDFNE